MLNPLLSVGPLMLTGQSWPVRFERGGAAFVGSAMVLTAPMLGWADSAILTEAAGRQVKLTEYGAGGLMLLAWLVAVYLTAREDEAHWWNCFFKGVGMPGTLLALGKIFSATVS